MEIYTGEGVSILIKKNFDKNFDKKKLFYKYFYACMCVVLSRKTAASFVRKELKFWKNSLIHLLLFSYFQFFFKLE